MDISAFVMGVSATLIPHNAVHWRRIAYRNHLRFQDTYFNLYRAR